VPHASDDFHLREARRFAAGPLRRTFGARLRRYRRYQAASITDERLVADFYWGDVAGTGGDLLRVVTGLVKVVLGLSHAIRENAASVWPHRPWLRRLAGFAALVVHGPVFALNLILLGGVFLGWGLVALARLADPAALLPGPAGPWLMALMALAGALLAWQAARVAPVVAALAGLMAGLAALGLAVWAGPVWCIGAAAVLAGAVLGALSHAFLLRHLADWLILCGAGVLVLAALDRTVSPGLLATRMPGLTQPVTDPGVLEVYALGGWLLAAAVLAWGLSIGAALVLLAARWWRPLDRHPGAPPADPMAPAAPVDFLAAAIGLMTLLAMLLIAAVWGALVSLPVQVLPDYEPVYQGLAMALPAVLCLVALLAVAAAQAVRTRLSVGTGQGYMADRPDALAETGRIVVARPLLRVLEGFVVAVAALSVLGLLQSGPAPAVLADTGALTGFIAGSAGPVVLAVAGLAAVLAGALRAPLALGIGIATDVLIYLNSYSWTCHADGTPRAARPRPGRSWLEWLATDPARLLHPLTRAAPAPQPEAVLRARLRRIGRARLAPVLADPAPGQNAAGDRVPHGYWMRRRIHARLAVLMNELIANEAPDSILLVAHSQGTVIAIDMLDKAAQDWGRNRTLRLVTMGSPYTHLYHRYFPASFPSHRLRPGLEPAQGPAGLVAWVNLFRADDFIGTHLDAPRNRALGGPPGAWPRDVVLGLGGHTNYWVDGRILGPLQAAVSGGRDGPGPVSDRKTGAAAAGT
jgi:hypothetical protein